MAFVCGRLIAVGAGGTVPLPSVVDASGNNRTITLYSHMRIPAGPVTITFDSGQVYAITGDTIMPIPASATQFTSGGAITAQLGQET